MYTTHINGMRYDSIYVDYGANYLLWLKSYYSGNYVMEDQQLDFGWEIIEDETKEILGYTCIKAYGKDPVTNSGADVWFTPEIPISGGPWLYGGLPGVILEVNHSGLPEYKVVSVKKTPRNPLQVEKPDVEGRTTERYAEFVN